MDLCIAGCLAAAWPLSRLDAPRKTPSPNFWQLKMSSVIIKCPSRSGGGNCPWVKSTSVDKWPKNTAPTSSWASPKLGCQQAFVPHYLSHTCLRHAGAMGGGAWAEHGYPEGLRVSSLSGRRLCFYHPATGFLPHPHPNYDSGHSFSVLVMQGGGLWPKAL